nr:hypothetical protein [Tanacetum cinerariifolium]
QDGNSQQEEIDIVTETDDVLPPSDENDDDLSDDLLLGEADLFLSDNLIPPGIENVADDPEGDIRFLEELLINDSILSHESFEPNLEDTPLIPRPPLEPPDVESFFDLKPDHFSITPETESDEVTESNAENLLPIPSKCEVTLEDEIECNMPAKDVCSPVSSFSNPLFKDNDDLDFSDDESLPDEDNLLYDNSFPRPPEELNAEIADTIIESIPLLPIPVQDGNSQQEEIDIVTETDDVLPPSDENDDDLSDDLLLGEADLFLSDNLIPPGIENVADDPEGDIRFLEELLIDDSILSHESSDFEDNPSISRPPP